MISVKTFSVLILFLLFTFCLAGNTFASGSDVLEYKRVENLRIKEGKPLMREDGSPQVVYTLEHKDNLRDTAGARDRAIAKLASYDLVEVKTEVLEPSEA